MEDALRYALIAAAQLSSPWLAAHGPLDPYSVTWSLSVEWYFYLLWPVALEGLRRLDPLRAARACLIAAGVCYAAAVTQPGWWFYYAPPARFAALLVGAALALRLVAGNPVLASGTDRVAVATGMAFVAGWTVLGAGPYTAAYRFIACPLTIAATVAFIVAGYQAATTGPVRLLRWGPLAALGRISYSLYLWHAIPLALIPAGWLGQPAPIVAATVVGLALAGTLLGYVLLERPFTRSRGRQLAGHPTADLDRPAYATTATGTLPPPAASGSPLRPVS